MQINFSSVLNSVEVILSDPTLKRWNAWSKTVAIKPLPDQGWRRYPSFSIFGDLFNSENCEKYTFKKNKLHIPQNYSERGFKGIDVLWNKQASLKIKSRLKLQLQSLMVFLFNFKTVHPFLGLPGPNDWSWQSLNRKQQGNIFL